MIRYLGTLAWFVPYCGVLVWLSRYAVTDSQVVGLMAGWICGVSLAVIGLSAVREEASRG